MSISRQNLTIVIVTLKSEQVIHQCINSINDNLPIIVVENSNNERFKKELESKYKNLKCVLSQSNLGMGAGNNIGIKLAKTDYVFILNPDVELEPETLEKIYLGSQKISNFSILSPISSNANFPNYGMFNKQKPEVTEAPFKVDFVDGYAMVINKNFFGEDNYFDENIFLYLENNDLCLRGNKKNKSVYVIPNAKISHGGGKTVDSKYKNEIEFSRNWHWMWSKFYFNKKHFGLFKAIKDGIFRYFFSIIKFIFYFLINSKIKKKIYFNRASGFYNAFIGRPSWYRPKLDD